MPRRACICGELGAGVGLLDAAGQRRLAADGDAGAGGGAGAGDDARGEDQLVVGAQGMDHGIDFVGHHGGGQPPAPHLGVLLRYFLVLDCPRCHVHAQDFCHFAYLLH